MQKIICPACGNKKSKIDRETLTIENEKYVWETLYCSECGQLLYSDEVQIKNIERKRAAVRRARGLCSYEDLIKLPKRYGVSRELLTVILDLDRHGDGIWTSVWDGEIPSEEESERIKAAWKPECFRTYLEAKRDAIPEDKYAKVMKRVEGMVRKRNR